VDKVRAAAARLKVFPLPSVVLLPGTALPLHIFEARYRAMVEDALATDGVFAMAQVVPGQEGRLSESPDLEPLLCAGVVGLHERLEDGRYNLVLVGAARARIKRELKRGRAWREVEAEVLVDGPAGQAEELQLRQAVYELMARVPSGVGQRLAQATARVTGGLLADVVGAAVFTDVIQRFELLSELDVTQRMRCVTDEVMELVARLKPVRPDGLLN